MRGQSPVTGSGGNTRLPSSPPPDTRMSLEVTSSGWSLSAFDTSSDSVTLSGLKAASSALVRCSGVRETLVPMNSLWRTPVLWEMVTSCPSGSLGSKATAAVTTSPIIERRRPLTYETSTPWTSNSIRPLHGITAFLPPLTTCTASLTTEAKTSEGIVAVTFR